MKLRTALPSRVSDQARALKSQRAGYGKGGYPRTFHSRLSSLFGKGSFPGWVLWVVARNSGICLFTEIIDFPNNFACHKGQGFL
jgi:hypothetical protein